MEEMLELIRLSSLLARDCFFSLALRDSADADVSRLLDDMLLGRPGSGEDIIGDFENDFLRDPRERQPSIDRRREDDSRPSGVGEVGMLRIDETDEDRAVG